MSRPAPRVSIDITRPLSELPCHLTLAEAAAYLRREIRTLYNWEASGLIRLLRPAGGHPIVQRSEIERLLAEAV